MVQKGVEGRKNSTTEISLSLVCEEEALSEAQLSAIKKQEEEIRRVSQLLDRLHHTHNVVEKGPNVCAMVPKEAVNVATTKVAGRIPNVVHTVADASRGPRQIPTNTTPLPVPPLILQNAPSNTRPASNTYQFVMDRHLSLIVGAVTSPQTISAAPVIQGTTTMAKTPLTATNIGGSMMIPTSAIMVNTEAGVTAPVLQRVVKMTPNVNILTSSPGSQIPIMSHGSEPSNLVNMPSGARPFGVSKASLPTNVVPPQVAPSLIGQPQVVRPQLAQPQVAQQQVVPGIAVSETSANRPSFVPIAPLPEETRVQDSSNLKLNGKLFPSLLVTLKPCLQSKEFTASVCTKLRSELDKELKKVLLLFPSELTEWLIQQGLIRAEQKCHTHLDSLYQPIPYKLGIYSDSSKFPNSGGYVWVSDCCGQRHLSVFAGSLFEGVPHTPKTMLKLIYHWACQTSPTNIAQWVQVDMNYIKSFNAAMRAVCICVVHEKLTALGGEQKEVEVAIMTLGTSSNDGKLKQVKVEILGVLDKEKHIVRLLAVEPTKKIPGAPTVAKRDYHQILAPLSNWVDKKSTIVTDLSIDQACLHELGFLNVRQTSSTVRSDRNLRIVEYLSTSIPRSFQNVLPMLNRVSIQQFLDEISWREKFGPSPMQSFKNLVVHLAELTKLELDQTMMALLNRISNDPFQNWEYKNLCKKPAVLPSPNPLVNVVPLPLPLEDKEGPISMIDRLPQSIRQVDPPPPPVKRVRKRLAEPEPTPPPLPVPDTSKKHRQQTVLQEYYYGRIRGRSKEDLDKEEAEWRSNPANSSTVEFQCCVCHRSFDNNLLFMRHLMKHTQSKGSVDAADDTPVCKYCLRTFVTPYILESHVKDAHIVKKGQLACRICNIEFFSTSKLIQHMHTTHVELELPYSCKVCGYRSSMHRDVVDHFHESHDGSRKLQCPFCLQVVTLSGKGKLALHNVFLFFQHIQKHVVQSPTIKCDKCILRFATRGNVMEHLARDHTSCKGKPGLTRLQFKGESIIMPIPTQNTQLTTVKKDTEPQQTAVTPRVSSLPPGNNGKVKPIRIKIGIDVPHVLGLPQEEVKIRKTDENMSFKCCECKSNITQERHYLTNLSCPQCRYTTCCSYAIQTHLAEFHIKDDSDAQRPSIDIKLENKKKPLMLKPMYCICGFGDTCGNNLAKHLALSECRTAYTSVEGTKSLESQSASFPPLVTLDDQGDQDPSDQMMKAYAERMAQSSISSPSPGAAPARSTGEPQSMLNILGLVRKASTDESSNDVPDSDDKGDISLKANKRTITSKGERKRARR